MGTNNLDDYGFNLATCMTIAAFLGITWIYALELQLLIFTTFKQYRGLYFWSVLLSSWGCAINPLGHMLFNFKLWKYSPEALGVMFGISFIWMVTGQALVLFSRLHLVVRNKRKIRWVLGMIITNFLVLHIPIWVISTLAYSTKVSWGYKLIPVFQVYEKVQVTLFSVQETIISGMYLWEAHKLLKPGSIFRAQKSKNVMHRLVAVNVFVILLDVCILSMEFSGLYLVQTFFKPFVYSLKLRLEFFVLNQLMNAVQGKTSGYNKPGSPSDGPSSGKASGMIGNGQKSEPSTDMSSHGGEMTLEKGNGYSASATRDLGSPVNRTHVDGVFTTTKVEVYDSPTEASTPSREAHALGAPSHPDYSLRHGNNDAVIGTPWDTEANAVSRTSSNVQFAGRGA